MKEGVLDWEMHEDKRCINCGETHHFDYCPNCGQPYEKKEITFGALYNDFKERVIGLDGKFIRTVIESFKSPGNLSRTFISGNRTRFVGPVGFFFIALTIYLVIMTSVGATPSEILRDQQALGQVHNNPQADSAQFELMKAMMDTMSENFKIISFFSVIILGFFTWLFNLRKNMNYLEHLVFAFYYYGVVYLLSPLQFLFLSEKLIYVGGSLAMLIQVGYFIWAYIKFDNEGSLFKRIFKSIIIQIAMTATIGLIAIGGTVLYLLQNKEILESMKAQ